MALNKNEFHLKRNDTLPALKLQLIDRSCLGSRTPFDLTDVSSATFTMKNSCGDIKIMAKAAQILSFSGGVIQYNWEADDTNDSGTFDAEFQLIYSNGKRLSIPQIGAIKIQIENDVNPY
jgi:hypothetical protein